MAVTQQAAAGSPSGARRRSRLGLYAPFIALGALALVWSIAWAIIRARTESGLDEWLAAEAGAGRRWSCANRSVAGYPFRIEVRCAALTVDRADARATLGPLLVVSQVYRPRHIVAEVGGPLQVSAGSTSLTSAWRLLRLSLILADHGFERASLSADDSTATIATPGLDRIDLASRRLEAHVRPRDASAYEVVGRLAGASLPGLDWLVGGTELADAEMQATVTGADGYAGRPLASELERWRQAGGKFELTRLAVGKGPRRMEGRGAFGLDVEHRVAGELTASATNLEGFLGRFVGERAGLGGAILGALLGRGAPAPAAGPTTAAPALRPLPPVRFESGRVYVGPLAFPGIRLPPLY